MNQLSLFLSSRDVPFCALMAALVIYGAFGVPTPEHISLCEITIGLLLLVAAGAGGISAIFTPLSNVSWLKAGQVFFLYGFSVPLAAGVIAGHDVADILRDAIPFMFIMLPLFMCRHIRTENVSNLMGAAALIGWLFSMRLLWPYLTSGDFSSVSDPQRLANAPTVLFCAMWMMGMAGEALYNSARPRNMARAVILVIAALPPIAAMAMINQRASLGLMVVGFSVLLIIAAIHRPVRALAPFLAVIVSSAIFYDEIALIAQNMMHKTALVGLNMRGQEFYAVLNRVGENMLTIITGQGWGAGISSPATGDQVVSYTHNLFTTYLLKTGLAGCVLIGLWLWSIVRVMGPALVSRPVIAFALLAPFLIDITLYASFKSLDFGVLLLVMALQGLSVAPDKRL